MNSNAAADNRAAGTEEHSVGNSGVGNTWLRRFGEKQPPNEIAEVAIVCRERLGGLLKHYYRQAA